MLGTPLDGLARYLLAGGFVFGLYVGLTLVLSDVAGLPIQWAIPSAYLAAVVVHFLLQRHFVFAGDHALDTRRQLARYAVVGILQYLVIGTGTAVLTAVTDLDESVAFVIAAVTSSLVTFTLLRTAVFHAPPASEA